MDLQYGEVSRLDKLMLSLKNHLFMGPENNEKFLSDVRFMIEKDYSNHTDDKKQQGEYSNTEHTKLTQESKQRQMDNIVNSLAI
jgi:hypothetical protein